MKISLRYDIFKNNEPISNGCPAHLIQFMYEIFINPATTQSNWNLYNILPTQLPPLRYILSTCEFDGFDEVVEEHIDAPIINDQITMYVVSPLGDSRLYLGLLPPNNKSFIDLMSKKAKELIQNRSMKLVIDYSAEGYNIQRASISELHTLLHNEKIPLDNVYFVSSNLSLEKSYKTWCNDHKVKPLNLITGPFFEFNSLTSYQQKKYDVGIFQQLNMLDKRIRLKKFLCFNRRPHAHRHALVCLLSMENLLNDSFVSWPPNIDYSSENKENLMWHDFIDIFSEKSDYYAQLMIESKKLEKIAPLIVDHSTFFENFAYGYETSDSYQNSYFSVVTETIFSEEDEIFFSEKIWKPIANLHPFLLVATAGSLSKLRELGYKTFSPYINESYDLIENDADRLLAIVNEMKRLNNMQIDKLNDMYYNDILPILTYNKEWFYSNPIHHISIPLQKLIN